MTEERKKNAEERRAKKQATADKLREDQRQEAIKRMEALKISRDIIEDFKKGIIKKISVKRIPIKDEKNGKTDYLAVIEKNDLTKEEQKQIKEIEENYKMLVYYTTENKSDWGLLFSLFVITNYKSEWKLDREDLKENIIYAYVINKTDNSLSEYGSIGIKNFNGLIIREY